LSAVLVPFLLAVADRLDLLRNRAPRDLAATVIAGRAWAWHRALMASRGWLPDDYVTNAANDMLARGLDVPFAPPSPGFPLYVSRGDQERLLEGPALGASTVPAHRMSTWLGVYATLTVTGQPLAFPGGGPAALAPSVWTVADAQAVLQARAAAAAPPPAPLAAPR
jgi:hypothetical protein